MIFKKKILYLFILILSIGVFVLIFSNKEKNYANTKPSFVVNSNELINAYIQDEEKANALYTDKLIEISGTIKKINYLNQKSSIILNSDFNDSGIICELNNSESSKLSKLSKNRKVIVKGICKGFLKDVVLLNCYLDTIKTYE